MTNLTTKTTEATTDRRAEIEQAIKDALDFRAALLARGNWSQYEMQMAGDRIAAAQAAMARLMSEAA